MSLTTDRNDPELNEVREDGQNKKYLVKSEEELELSEYPNPVRHSYVHVGMEIDMKKVRTLTPEESERYAGENYVGYMKYDESESPVVGIFLRADDLTSGCEAVTRISDNIAKTWASDPYFYSSTYCVYCKKHFDIDEFVWEGTNIRLGD